MVGAIHSYCAENQVQWHEMIELNEFMENTTKICIRKKLDDISRDALYMIPQIFERHIKNNTPEQKNIWDLNLVDGKPPEKTDHNISNHWQHISHDYTYMQAKLTQEAIENELSEVVSTGIHGFNSMTSTTINSNNLGNEQVRIILNYISYEAKRLLIDASKKDFWDRMVKISPFDSFSITNCLDKKKMYSNILLLGASRLQLDLLKAGRLPIFELNDLGTAGRHCIHEIEKSNDIYEQSINFIVAVFSEMRKLLERNLSDDRKNLYLEVYSQLESLQRWKGKKSKEIKEKISTGLDKFSKITKIKKELKKEDMVWPLDK